MFESVNVCTRSMSRRGRGRPKGGSLLERKKSVPQYTTKEKIVQTKQLEVIELPSLCTWAVKKRRSPSCPCSTQNSDKKSAITYTNEMEGPNTPPQPDIKKRKLEHFILLPVHIFLTDDSFSKEIFRQPSCVGNRDASEFKNQGFEIVCDSENVNGNQHLLVDVFPNTELYEPNNDSCKTSTNLIEENVDSASTNYGAILNISTQASYVDICHREMSQPLICVGISQASALPVQGTEINCSYEKINGDQHLVDNFSPKAQLFDSNDDCCKTSGCLNNENVDLASINEGKLHISNSTSIVSHKKAGSKNLATTTDLLAPSACQNNIQNQLLEGNVVSNPCMHERAEHSKEKQTNSLPPGLSSMEASPTLGDNDALQDQTLHLQSRYGLLAAEQEHDQEIDLNKVPTGKPKKRKHRPKILKDVSFVTKPRSKIQVNSVASKLPKGRNFGGDKCQAKTPTFNKEALNNSCLRNSEPSHSVTDVNSATNRETLSSSELSGFQSDTCQNDDVPVQNKCNNKELISRVAYEQAKLMEVALGNHVRSVDGSFPKNSSSAIARGKKKAKLKDLARRKKKAKLKDLARKKKPTNSEEYIEKEENASALTMQIVSMNPLVKLKGKRSPRKKLVIGSQNVKNSLCLINPTVPCENRSAITVNSGTVTNHWQDVRVGFQSQNRANCSSHEQALCADIPCLCKKNTNEQGHRMVSEHIIQDCQNRDKVLLSVQLQDALDAIQERLKNLTFEEDQVCSTRLHSRQEMIPLERKDDLIPSAKCLSLVPYEDPFETLKIKKFRPRVLLHSETMRDSNLLTGKGGIEDETDDNEKEKLKQERSVFKNRAESFISCMRILQGNRQFSPWKGSVVDSVVGAFLTQNVSDHLSSSAFISLASRFPHAESTQIATPNAKGLDTIVLDNTSYSYVTCELVGQNPDLLKERNHSRDFYMSNLSCEERFSYHSVNSVVNGMCKVPSPHSHTSDLLIGMDGSNSCGKFVQNHIFSHPSGFGRNTQVDTMFATEPLCHVGSSTDSSSASENSLEKSCIQLLEKTEREEPFNLQGADTVSDDTVAVNDSFQESKGSNSEAKLNESRMTNSSHLDHHNFSSQFEFFDETTTLCIGSSQYQGSGFPNKTCESILVQRDQENYTAVYVENELSESKMRNAKFNGKTAPNDLGLSIELPQNAGSRLHDKVCESTLLQRHLTVPDVSGASVENEQAEIETRNVKFHREMTPEEVGLSIELPQNPSHRLPDKVCETILLQRDKIVPELCTKSVQDDTTENGMGNTAFQGEIAQEDLGFGGETQVLPDLWQSLQTMELDDGWRSVPVKMTNERLVCTHTEHNRDHSHAREKPSYGSKIGYHSLGQALPYTFIERSCQERHQVCGVSDCQCSSSASDAPIHNIFDSKVPKRPRSDRRFGSTKDPISRASHIKNLISRTFYIKDSISKTSGIARAAMEMTQGNGKKKLDWESIKKNAKEFNGCAVKKERCPNSKDSANWDAVRCADLEDIADAIKERGMNNVLAGRIKSFLEMLHIEHGSIDLEWLKDLPPDDAKKFLLNIRGMGLKSVECIRLLTLQQLAFPVDTNVARIVVRLGWVPLAPLPESLLIHKLEEYPYLNSIQQYLWPRLCTLDQRTLYELHYQLITFGKVFCQKSRPNCNACPMKLNCKHFASAFASARQALPAPADKSLSMPISSFDPQSQQDSYPLIPLALPPISSFDSLSQKNPYTLDLANISVGHVSTSMQNYEPIIEEPSSPEHKGIDSSEESAADDSFDMDSEEIPIINLNCNDSPLQIYKPSEIGIQHLDATDTSTALVVVPPESASIPLPKLKNVSRLRTEHQVYEIPDNHQLLSEFDPREPDDPCSYLLAIWSPGEKVEKAVTPGPCCTLNGSHEYQCEHESCSSCTIMRGINDNIVKGTVLIPCKTAMRGSFPLNGTYFQVNEVFADHRTSLCPIEVPRNWIWNLQRRTVYFSTSIPSIFRGLHAEAIQECFWKGYVCVRGFERKTRAPRPLVVRLHFPASRKDKDQDTDV